jgi:hypothetical protein
VRVVPRNACDAELGCLERHEKHTAHGRRRSAMREGHILPETGEDATDMTDPIDHARRAPQLPAGGLGAISTSPAVVTAVPTTSIE